MPHVYLLFGGGAPSSSVPFLFPIAENPNATLPRSSAPDAGAGLAKPEPGSPEPAMRLKPDGADGAEGMDAGGADPSDGTNDVGAAEMTAPEAPAGIIASAPRGWDRKPAVMLKEPALAVVSFFFGLPPFSFFVSGASRKSVACGTAL